MELSETMYQKKIIKKVRDIAQQLLGSIFSTETKMLIFLYIAYIYIGI